MRAMPRFLFVSRLMLTDQQIRSQHPLGGLTSEQVEINREKYGANVLTPPEREPWWRLF
jgi:Ca2+-transporting ATPase